VHSGFSVRDRACQAGCGIQALRIFCKDKRNLLEESLLRCVYLYFLCGAYVFFARASFAH
jgi:hypothetical protein